MTNAVLQLLRDMGAGFAQLGRVAKERPFRLLTSVACILGVALSWRVHPILGTLVSLMAGTAVVLYVSGRVSAD